MNDANYVWLSYVRNSENTSKYLQLAGRRRQPPYRSLHITTFTEKEHTIIIIIIIINI